MLLAMQITESAWDLFLKSPLLISLISIFGVKLLDYMTSQRQAARTEKAEIRHEWQDEIAVLRKELQQQNAKNDLYVIENAKLSARVTLLETQNALQTSEMARITHERDGLRKDLDTTGEFLHQTKLELTAAKVRISQLEKHIERLEAQANPGATT